MTDTKKRCRPLVETKSSPLVHPLGIKPLGNFYFDQLNGIADCKIPGFGKLTAFSDEFLLLVLENLETRELMTLSSVSRAFYVLSHHDEIWRARVLLEFEGRFEPACSSWRCTYFRTAKIPHTSCCHTNPISINGFYSDLLYQSFLCASRPILPAWIATANVPKRDNLSLADFRTEYENPNVPVIITDVVKHWPAFTKWTQDFLEEVCGEETFSAGGFRMTMKEYFNYARKLKNDDQPLYIFDKAFAEKVPQLAADYVVPDYFQQDLFQTLGKERPAYRWLIVGPERSGSSFHIDPNSTSAWNAVIRGRKKWIMFPPDIVPPGVHPSVDGSHVSTPVSLIEWFLNFYVEMQKQAKSDGIQPYECIVEEGEMIFVPRGWWHLVLNLEPSIAITQNYVSQSNLSQVLTFFQDKPDQVSGCSPELQDQMHEKFTHALEQQYPQLLQLAQDEIEKAKQPVGMWQKLVQPATLAESSSFSFGF